MIMYIYAVSCFDVGCESQAIGSFVVNCVNDEYMKVMNKHDGYGVCKFQHPQSPRPAMGFCHFEPRDFCPHAPDFVPLRSLACSLV